MKHIIGQTKSIFLICAVIALLVACQNPDTPSTFTKPAETRLSEAVNKYYDALCNSKEGWVLEYEDSTLRLGRYSFAMKFKTSGEVEVISDIPSQLDTRVGYYTVNIGNTVELSFSTYTQLHYLSDTEIGDYGKGLGAGFGFLITDISEDGNTITMRQKAGKHKTVYLKKITSSFQEIKDRYVAQASMDVRLSSVLQFRPGASPFSMLKNPSGTMIAVLKYNAVFRQVYLGLLAADVKKTKDTIITFSITINQEGFLLVNSKLPTDFPLKDLNFTWDTARKIFYNSENYTIQYGGYADFSEASRNKIYDDFVSEFSLRYVYLTCGKDAEDVIDVFEASSPAAQALLTDSIKSLSMYFSSNLTRVVVRFMNVQRDLSRYDTFNVVYPKPVTGGALLVHAGRDYNSADAKKHFTTTPSGQHADALFDLFAAPEGLLIAPEGELLNYDNKTYRIIFLKDPAIYFIAYGSSAK